jgi:uncharacterized protein (DUF1330 family)
MVMAAEANKHVRIYGLSVHDDIGYARYREHMLPILGRFGGSFGYDFIVARQLKGESERPINRLFTIQFPSAERADAFFADESYRAVRAQYFAPAVDSVTLIATFDERSAPA